MRPVDNRWLFVRWGMGLTAVLLVRSLADGWVAGALSVALVIAAGFTAQAESRRAATAHRATGEFRW